MQRKGALKALICDPFPIHIIHVFLYKRPQALKLDRPSAATCG